jgi:hypothetical protein
MGFVQWVKDKVAKVQGYVKIRDDVYTSHSALTKALRKQFPEAYVFVTDTRPYGIYRADMAKVARMNVGMFKKWTKEKFDCENKAAVMAGIMSWFYGNHAFGTVCVELNNNTLHMLNCYVDEYMTFQYFEPQTNQSYTDNTAFKRVIHIII